MLLRGLVFCEAEVVLDEGLGFSEEPRFRVQGPFNPKPRRHSCGDCRASFVCRQTASQMSDNPIGA